MSILLNNNGYDNKTWHQELSAQLPEQSIYTYEQINDLDAVEYAVIWNHPAGDLMRYPNLKGILLLGAGTEHIDADTNIPDLPIVRLIDPEVLKDMGLYTLYWVMNRHRLYDTYRQQQQETVWQRYNICQPSDFRITVLGLGAVGKEVANRLSLNGFNVNGWDAFPQTLSNAESFHGKDHLPKALSQADVLVNCLPLNPGTEGFINSDVLKLMKQDSQLINISRGSIIDDDALLSALESGQIGHAVLDTFAIEPLPQQSPYWKHLKVTVTPHISGATYARSAAKLIADNIRRIEKGEQPFPIYQHPARITDISHTSQ